MSNELSLTALWTFFLGKSAGGGKSAYDYAVEGGYSGTEAEFAARLAVLMDSGTVIGTLDGENRIILTGELSDGGYTVSYRMTDGSLVSIGDMTLGDGEDNLLPTAQNADGTPFDGSEDGNGGGDGYKYGYRISLSSGNQTATDGVYCTGFMPAASTDTISVSNVEEYTANTAYNNILFYDADFTRLGGTTLLRENGSVNYDESTGTYSLHPSGFVNGSVAWFRFSCGLISEETLVTVTAQTA